MSIFVGNLPFRAEQEDVIELFAQFGEVTNCALPLSPIFIKSEAAAACQSLGARAFAVGNVIVFADESPSLETVAHEVTHALLDGVHPRFDESTNPDVLAFQEVLRKARVRSHIRASRGRDIAAACGQLRHEAKASA